MISLKKMNTTYPYTSSDFDGEFIHKIMKAVFTKKDLTECTKALSLRGLNRSKLKLVKGKNSQSNKLRIRFALFMSFVESFSLKKILVFICSDFWTKGRKWQKTIWLVSKSCIPNRQIVKTGWLWQHYIKCQPIQSIYYRKLYCAPT